MAISTCSKCGGHSFELMLFTPIGESRKLTLVQCSACGTAVGAIDPSTGPQIEAGPNCRGVAGIQVTPSNAFAHSTCRRGAGRGP
jgi:hypothetical protein